MKLAQTTEVRRNCEQIKQVSESRLSMYLSLDHLSDPGIAQRVRRAEAETRWTLPDMTMLITDEKKKNWRNIHIMTMTIPDAKNEKNIGVSMNPTSAPFLIFLFLLIHFLLFF